MKVSNMNEDLRFLRNCAERADHADGIMHITVDVIFKILDELERMEERIEHLTKVGKKMHTWIFLNSADEEEAYRECGLTDEDNALLGYGGKLIIEVPPKNEE